MSAEAQGAAMFMARAIEEAKKSAAELEVPVGAVIIKGGEIIATGRNRRETLPCATAHAEIEAIEAACKKLGSWRLHGCEMFVTLEPCAMCAGAIINARLDKITFGAFDHRMGACHSLVKLFDFPFNHKPELVCGLMEEECAALLSDFFKKLRDRKKK